MAHDPARILLIAALAAVGLVILVPLIVAVVHKLFFFDWPELYEWQQARRQLRSLDQGWVIWATHRHHPVSRATLAEAHLAYARYRQDVAQRALNRQRRRRGLAAMIAVIDGVVAAGWAALAATQSQQRILGIVAAASFAGNTLVLALAPGSSRRQIERMDRLQAEIERALSTPWVDDWTCIGGPAGLVNRFLGHPDLHARPVALGQDATPPGHQAL